MAYRPVLKMTSNGLRRLVDRILQVKRQTGQTVETAATRFGRASLAAVTGQRYHLPYACLPGIGDGNDRGERARGKHRVETDESGEKGHHITFDWLVSCCG